MPLRGIEPLEAPPFIPIAAASGFTVVLIKNIIKERSGNMFVHELLRRGEPEAAAIIEKDVSYTYRGMARLTSAARDRLYALGIGRGDRVALFSRNSAAYVAIHLALSSLGAIAVPMNFQLSPRETAFILKDSGSTLLVADKPSEIKAGLVDVDCKNVRVVSMDDLVSPHANELGAVTLDSRQVSGLLAPSATLPHAPELEGITENDPYIIIYTSGTTGRPKGATLSHKNVISNAYETAERLGITSEDNSLCVLPMYHCFGWTAAVLTPLYTGGCLTVLPKYQPKDTIQTIKYKKTTVLYIVPSIASLILKLASKEDLENVRLSVIGGTALPEKLARDYEKKFGQTPTEAYGLSETSPIVTLNPPGKEKIGYIGIPMKDVETKIVDGNGKEVPDGETGELLVRGPIVMLGYWGRPDATKETIEPDGWLHTGDIVRRDEDGYLQIVDRIKDMIISMGENIYPREIEELVYKFPGIHECAVIGVPDKIRGQAGACYYSVQPDHHVDDKALKIYLRMNLALFKIPREFHEIDELPHTATGKISKRLLKEQRENA